MKSPSALFNKWLAKYPGSKFTKHALKDLEYRGSMGHFMGAVYDGDLDVAFAHADLDNLPYLEQLTGLTKQEFGEQNWGWVPFGRFSATTLGDV